MICFRKSVLLNMLAAIGFMVSVSNCGGGGAITKENSVYSTHSDSKLTRIALISHASVTMLIDNTGKLEQTLIAKKITQIERTLASKIPNSYLIKAQSEPYLTQFSQAIKEYNDFYTATASTTATKEAGDAIKLAAANFVYDETPKFEALAKEEIKKNDISHYLVVRMPAAKIRLNNHSPEQLTEFTVQIKLFAANTEKMIWIYNANVRPGSKTGVEPIAQAVIRRMKTDGLLKPN